MGTVAGTVLLAFLAAGCGSEPEAPPPPPPPSVPTEEDVMEMMREAVGPLPDLAIRIHPEVRAWDTGDDRWALEATLTLTNGGSAPIEVDLGRLRLRDQSRPLHGTSDDRDGRWTLAPGASRTVTMIASPALLTETGPPTMLRADYGTVAAMLPEVTAPVTAVRTDGLVATFSDPRAPDGVHTPYVHPRGSLPAWRVRLEVEVHNPTEELVRMRHGQLRASREDGTPSYWGDGAGLSVASRWFEPGARHRGTVVLMFPDSPTPPRRVTLTHDTGTPQTLELPERRP